MTKLWLTRTQPAADDSAVIWASAGFEPLVEPLLTIETVEHQKVSDEAVLIFTSKNGIDHLVCAGQRAICVGDATAAKARAAGYRDVVSVDGTSENVTEWIAENVSTAQPLIHISGWHVRGSITEDLNALGYLAKRVKVYQSIQSPNWPEDPFPYVVFYSPLAARTFTEIAIDLCKDISKVTAICISQATAGELSALALQSVVIAKRPREDELIMAAKSS